MAQVPVGSPLHEAYLGDQLGPHPAHRGHLFRRHAATPTRGLAVREIDEGATRGVQRLKLGEHLPPHVGREARADLTREVQFAVLVVANQQGVDAVTAGTIAADHELLLPIQLQLLRRGAPLDRNVVGVQRLGVSPS
jgi:hypothetical protein